MNFKMEGGFVLLRKVNPFFGKFRKFWNSICDCVLVAFLLFNFCDLDKIIQRSYIYIYILDWSKISSFIRILKKKFENHVSDQKSLKNSYFSCNTEKSSWKIFLKFRR